MRIRNPYFLAGLASVITGSLLVLLGQFIFLVNWLTALGVVLLILSLIFFVLGRTVPKLPPAYSRLLLETGMNNISAMVEELGINTRAIYLPAGMTGGRSRALIPLHDGFTRPQWQETPPDRMIVRYGESPDDVGLMVTTVGTAAVAMLGQKPGETLPELEAALNLLVSGTLGVADGVGVSESQGQVVVEINRPHIELEQLWSDRCLGGPLASLVAAVTAFTMNYSVQVASEERVGDKYRVELKVLA
ncbi:MAG: hypothetical protein WC369_06785 [Dehalococcoidales bacterium]